LGEGTGPAYQNNWKRGDKNGKVSGGLKPGQILRGFGGNVCAETKISSGQWGEEEKKVISR